MKNKLYLLVTIGPTGLNWTSLIFLNEKPNSSNAKATPKCQAAALTTPPDRTKAVFLFLKGSVFIL